MFVSVYVCVASSSCLFVCFFVCVQRKKNQPDADDAAALRTSDGKGERKGEQKQKDRRFLHN